MTAPDDPSRKQGHSKLVYDKERRTIVDVDPSPALAHDRAKLVAELGEVVAHASMVGGIGMKWVSLVSRARDMIVADAAAPLPESVELDIRTLRHEVMQASEFKAVATRVANRLESLSRALAAKDEECTVLVAGITDQQHRREKCEAKCSALEADVRRLDKLEEILAAGWYLDSWAGRSGYAFFTGCNGESKSKFSAETVRAVLDAALASQPPEGKA